MTGTLYGAYISPFFARVVIQIEAKTLDIETAPPVGGGMKSEEYLKLNPIGKIPTFVDGHVTIPESAVICEYLEDTYPQKPLRPAIAADRAKAMLINRVFDLYVIEPLLLLFQNLNPAERNQAVVDLGLANTMEGLKRTEMFISEGPYAIGMQMTLADCAIAPVLFYMERIMPMFGVDDHLAETPTLRTYWAALQKDAAVKTVLERMDVAVSAAMGG